MSISFFTDELSEVKAYKRKFLEEMNRLIQWGEWVELDITVDPKLVEGTEEDFHGNSGYFGVDKRADAIQTNKSGTKIRYNVCVRPSSLKKRFTGKDCEAAMAAEHAKSSVRCKVEYVFTVVNCRARRRGKSRKSMSLSSTSARFIFRSSRCGTGIDRE